MAIYSVTMVYLVLRCFVGCCTWFSCCATNVGLSMCVWYCHILLLLFLYPGSQFSGCIEKLSIQKNKAGMVPNPAGPQQKNCRAARQS